MARSGPKGFGRFAALCACAGTRAYHSRCFLAGFHPKGFVSPFASIAHPAFETGANVYVGDKVVAIHDEGGAAVTLGDRVQVYGDAFFRTGSGGGVSIGDDTHIQPGCFFIACVSDIRIGGRVEIAAGCAFYSFNHGMEGTGPIMDQPLTSRGPIVVGDGAWLGHGVKVLDGVTIGPGAVVGAGAVVIRDIPANAIAVGVPARVVGTRS